MAIKAEPGHHDKISMGLFPSDVKSEKSSYSSGSGSGLSSKIKLEGSVKIETETETEANSVNVKVEANYSSGAIKNEKNQKNEMKSAVAIITPPGKSSVTQSVAPRRSVRRGRGEVEADIVGEVEKEVEDKDEEIVMIKRRGQIVR